MVYILYITLLLRTFIVNKPSSPELTPDQIAKFEQYLENPETIDRLRDTQKAIVEYLKKKQAIKKHISTFRERDGIKSKESALEKINSHRRDEDALFDIKKCTDLIGAQILCPYPDDVMAIIDWLLKPNGGKAFFRIVSKKEDIFKKQKTREDTTGYRAYHVCLKIKPKVAQLLNLPINAQNEHFELQIKTTLEAGWDFKTHDISYKAKDADQELQMHMKLISDSLNSIDKQTVLLRDRLIEEQLMLQELRIAARSLLFYVTLKNIKKESEAILGVQDKNIEQWKNKDLSKIENSLEKYVVVNGVDCFYTVGLALVALCSQNHEKRRYLQEITLSYASYLVSKADKKGHKRRYISSLRIRALLRWAFNKTRYAVDDMSYVCNQTNEPRDINDCLYYISELSIPSSNDIELAQNLLKILESTNKPEHLDTIGAYYIRFGKNTQELQQGLDYIRKAQDQARETNLKPVLDAFCRYHEYIYLKQLSKLRKVN
jgi:ppGpp synthetase/RelA/SpoT-type nucleotidyltranferase